MGTGKSKKTESRPKPSPFYPLDEIKNLVEEDRIVIRSNALKSALDDFEFAMDDIKTAISLLQLKHFYKSENSKMIDRLILDVYKARNLLGENIYTHLYIDDNSGKLIINSFKRL
jgi:hypothetical protein